MKRKVAVTGLGVVCPVGLDTANAWQNIVNGVSGIKPIETLDTSNQYVNFGGTIKDFPVYQYLSVKDARKMDPFIHYAMGAGVQAIVDSGLEVTEANADRIGVSIGSGIGGLETIEKTAIVCQEKGPKRISPFFIPSAIINMASGHLSIRYGLQGPNISVATACASATHSIGLAMRMIESGDADVMIAGGAEMPTTNCGLGGFTAVQALSRRNDSPEAASRPWDIDRDGFVLADGSGVLVLEEYEIAKARGAHIYAYCSGFGMNSDAHHMTSPLPDGTGAMRCMKATIDNAAINANELGYINAHGTSTPLGDLAETEAIKLLCGNDAYSIPISSTKSMTGHLLGAAGGIEAVFTVLAIQNQIAPPTINLETPGEGCDLDYVPNEARECQIQYALSNSFGFGGTNSSLLFSKP